MIAVPMIFGFCYLFIYDSGHRISTMAGFLANAVLALIFGVPLLIAIRRLLEGPFACQEVAISETRLTWSRRTKLWSRTHHLSTSDISDVATHTPVLGEHGVRVITRNGRRVQVLQNLSTESAIEAARELKKALRE
jgi:hypothetical protein